MLRPRKGALLAALAAAFAVIAALAQAQDYQIQIGDRLDISVVEDPGLNRQVLVRPDGKISLPLAGTLVAAGRTTEALQAAISRGLSRDFVQPPTVTVSLAALNPALLEDAPGLASVYVLGQVNAPGRIDVELPANILQVLAIVGGPSPFAAQSRIQIRRQTGNGQTILLFDYDIVEAGLTPTDYIAIQDGDVIVVPERGLFE